MILPGQRVCIGKSKSLVGTVLSVKGTLADVQVDGHSKPTTFQLDSLSPKIRKVSKSTQLPPEQMTIALSKPEEWKDQFLAQFNSNRSQNPFDLLPRRYANASARKLDPGSGPFNFDQFQGFGLFLQVVRPLKSV
jgi:hypothetical protein